MYEHVALALAVLVLIASIAGAFWSYEQAVATLAKKQTKDIIVLYKQGNIIKVFRITDSQVVGVSLDALHTYIYLVNTDILMRQKALGPK